MGLKSKTLSSGKRLSTPTPGDEVVIAGIAGRYPESDNVYELQESLFNKVDLVTDDSTRWFTNDPETPKRIGKIKQINIFDADFFGISDEEAAFMDPKARTVLETAYEAIVDAGINPKQLRGSRTAVFIGTSFCDSERELIYQSNNNGLGIIGCSRAMLANRISSWLGITGPSVAIDTACASSAYAFDQAFKSIRDGHCEAALVGGTNLCLNPNMSLEFARNGILSSDGRCKSFDVSADGYTRAECISVILLQKMAHAKRVYAKVVNTKTNCDGFKEEGITFPSANLQVQLLKELYEECGIPPQSVAYVEAHGTGTQVGDGVELKTLNSVFAVKRTKPLKIGSIKSNIGHTEPSSGITSVAKACIIFETGSIPPNLNFVTPIPGPIEKGILQVVTEQTPLEGNLIGINSFGFGGSNCHILLERNKVQKPERSKYMQQNSSLIVVSGRTQTSVNWMLDDVVKRKFDPEYYRLINDVHQDTIPGHVYRGYVVIAQDKLDSSMCISRKVNHLPESRRSIWFIFDRLCCTEYASFKQLLTIPPFSSAIMRCHQVLSPMGFDVSSIFSGGSNNVMESLIRNVCIQIGLVNTMETVGITPDYIIGDSIGELACAFADKCLSMEQTILVAYYVGKTLLFAKYKNYSEDDAVIHSILNKYLKMVITAPVERSNKWISLSSIRATSLNCKRFCSADYFTESLYTNVCLDKVLKCIPPNAITLQLGLQGKTLDTLNIGKRNATNITLLGNKHMDRKDSVAIGLGKLYLAGFDPNVAKLYPAIKFPVSRGTPMISPLVKWDHSKNWEVTNSFDGEVSGNRAFKISLNDNEQKYLSGHVIDGRNLFPAMGYLQLVWETMAIMRGQFFKHVSIIFEEVQFLRATNIPKEGSIEFLVSIQKGTERFEITESGLAVVTGRVFVPENITKEQAKLDLATSSAQNNGLCLSLSDIYKELRLRGYNFSDSFQGLLSCDDKRVTADILWDENWVCFLENMLQMLIMKKDTRHLYVPTGIQKLSINCNDHAQNILESNGNKFVKVKQYEALEMLKSPGVEIRGLTTTAVTRRKMQDKPVLEVYKFVPYYCNDEMTLQDILRVNITLALENSPAFKIRIVEILQDSSVEPVGHEVSQCLNNIPIVVPEVVTIPDVKISNSCQDIVLEQGHLENQSNCFMVIASNILHDDELLQRAVDALSINGFLLLREKLSTALNVPRHLQLLTSYVTNNERLMLLKRKSTSREISAIRIDDCDLTFRWLDTVKKAITTDNRVVLYAECQVTNGILGFVNSIRKEPGGEQVQCVFILDKNAPPFSQEDDFYTKQLNLNLAVNVFKDGQWGSYRYLSMDQDKLEIAEHAFVNITTRGDLSSLQWTKGPLTKSSASSVGTTLVQPYFVAVNFLDVLIATNKLTGNVFEQTRNKPTCEIGLEFSGVTTSGRRVMGFGTPPLLSTLIQADDYFMWDVPDGWTLQEAATVPLAFSTALHALVTVGRIREGMTILVHAGSGAVGQAAIAVALHHKCVVYTTASTEEKREFIRKRFPQVKDRHIGYSRDTSFEQLVLTQTKGCGVDLVLNSVGGPKLLASLRCLAVNGRFLEIGKYDLLHNSKVKMDHFAKGISIHGVSLNGSKILSDNQDRKKALHELLTAGIKSGIVRPLQFSTFKSNQVEDAFRHLASGNHIGKVLIQIRSEGGDKLIQPPIHTTPRFYCHPNMTYVVCGGLGGFGLELADWLVLRGAMKLVITSRSGITTGYQGLRVQTWRGYGCTVQISTVDCTTRKGCEDLLQDAESIGPVAAIFNLAVVLRDAILENQTTNFFKESFAPKVDVTRNLDVMSRKLCPHLQHFVVFSSVTCGRGIPGQTNYGMANSVMERICELRVQEGLPGLAIQWGAVGDVGLFADIQELDKKIVEVGGTQPQRISSCLEVMDNFLRTSASVVSSMVIAQKLSHVNNNMTAIDFTAKLLGVRDIRFVSAQTTFPELGMDSLMVVEMKQGLERDYGIFLTATEIRQLTFTRLKQLTESTNEVDAAASVV